MSTDRKNIIFDATILNNLQACAQKLYLGSEQDLIPVGSKPDYFDEGDLLHKMFEFYNLVLKDYGVKILYDNGLFPRLQKAASDYGQWISISLDLSQVECSEVIKQFNEYTTHTRMDGVTVIEAEKAFIIELFKDEELGVYYTGKIDRMTDTPSFGRVPRDYKSGGQRKKVLALNNQFTGYTLVTGSDIIIVDKVGFQKTLKPEDRFSHNPLYYNQFKKDKWKANTIWWAKQYAFYLENSTWPLNLTSCDKWSGCQFVEICDANDEEIRQHIIKTKFVIGEKWDVTAILKKDGKKSEEHHKMAEIAGNYNFDLRVA